VIRDPRPVFVVGSPRSGTSVCTWSLGQHSNILPLEETVWLPRVAIDLGVAHAVGSSRGDRSHLSASGITRDEMCVAVGRALHQLVISHRGTTSTTGGHDAFQLVRSAGDPKQRWVDGTPENSFWVHALRALFPEGRFVHLVRDVGAVVRSLTKFSNTGADDKSAEFGYRKWLRCATACSDAERAFGPGVVLRVRYEDLVTDPEPVLRRILTFLGEDFEPACVEPLSVRINSSEVPADHAVDLDEVDPVLLAEAEALSRSLQHDAQPQAPSATVAETLAAAYRQRIQFVGGLEADRKRALDALAALRARVDLDSLEQIRVVLRGVLIAPGAVAVVSKGADDVLDTVRTLGRRALHCPADDLGRWAGHHPADTEAAVASIETAVSSGATYLVIPWSCGWWLAHYDGLRAYLTHRFRIAWRDERCTIYELAPVPALLPR
jgi:Sulfotransferase family